MLNPQQNVNKLVNFMLECEDLKTKDGTPATMDACSTYMSHMHNLVFSKLIWECLIYPLYLEGFATQQKIKQFNNK